ncbi:Caskin/Ankyrin repeat-containing protein [Dioscorea alata]|uniref:Caskin/Ankyrin repeat-containing protein n=1 Tax=Dioscorea alata TaxID=55571 RepID=A0ACB7WM06_DIOAL|nr:Caskin/Ankyrin repeat-containing protein [Dioscorea alata]
MVPPSPTTVHGEIQDNKESTASSSNTKGETSKSQNNNAEINTKGGPVEEESPNEIRAAIMVIAVLVSTVTYQAILNPPGGFWQDDLQSLNSTGQNHTAGNPVMATKHPLLYGIFLAINAGAFVTSLLVMVFLFLPSFRWLFHYTRKWIDIPCLSTRKDEQQNLPKGSYISSSSTAVVDEINHLRRYARFVLSCLLLASALWVFQHLRGPGLVAFLIAFPSIHWLSISSIFVPRLQQMLEKEKEKEKKDKEKKKKESTIIDHVI